MVGTVRPQQGAATPWATSLATSLASGLIAMLQPRLCWCSPFVSSDGWDFACVLLECAFSVAYFDVFSCVAPQNIYIPKLIENVSYNT